MKRRLGIILATALIALAIPMSGVAAKPMGKVTICHKPAGATPVTISVSGNALKAHLAHGDRQGPCTPTTPPPAPTTCTFHAADSAYYNGPNNTYPLYATGPIHFSWTVATGVVSGTGGYWNELIGATTYFNNVTSGSVSGTGAVTLSFSRTVPNSYSFTFAGNLTGNVLSGTADGPYWFTATGTKTCV